MKGRCLLLVLLPLILLVACDDGARQRLQLEELERMNRADSLMTNDSLALDLAEWFDDHGTPNEQMRAYYILGRTYADLGEAPQAIEAYNDAADRADTTDADCDYYTLCRVYSQMSDILYNQNLLEEYLKISDLSIKHAWKAKDTLTVLSETALKMTAFNDLGETDSVLSVLHSVRKVFGNYYGEDKIAQYYVLPINALLKKNDVNTVRQLLYLYEEKSGFFDLDYTIAEGHEIYYYYKGLYYLAINQLDSAKYFFEKEYENGKDFNNQNASTHGLSLVFLKKHQYDSAAVYSQYAYALNDSANNHFTTQVVAHSQAMYNYSRNEQIAHQKTMEAIKFRNLFLTITVLVVVLLLLFAIFYTHYKSEKKLMKSKYQNEMEKLVQAQTDLLSMRSEQHVSDKLLAQKDKEIKELQQNLETYSKKVHILQGYALNKKLQEAAITCRLKQYLKENPYQIPDYNDWKQIKMLINQEIPTFYDRLNGDGHILTDIEYDVCMLIRLQISPSDISKFKQCVPSYITQIRKTIYKKIFNIDGLAENLDEFIMSID